MDELRMEDFQAMHQFGYRALFFKTPLCGTCKLAENLLELTFQTFNGQPVPTYTCRPSEWQHLVEDWQIESIPCLVFTKNGAIMEKIYAFESVTKLFEVYQRYQRH